MSMHSSAWVALLRFVPADQQNQLVLVTTGGTEIAMQCILRIDHEFMALKGRLAGSQDAGRVFFVPYSQIDYIGFAGEVKESAFHEMFGGLIVPAPPGVGVNGYHAPLAVPEEARSASAEPEGRNASEGSGKPGSGVRPAIRSEVLERYRSNRPTSSPSLQRPQRPEEG
jgi:hypothetical protein